MEIVLVILLSGGDGFFCFLLKCSFVLCFNVEYLVGGYCYFFRGGIRCSIRIGIEVIGDYWFV